MRDSVSHILYRDTCDEDACRIGPVILYRVRREACVTLIHLLKPKFFLIFRSLVVVVFTLYLSVLLLTQIQGSTTFVLYKFPLEILHIRALLFHRLSVAFTSIQNLNLIERSAVIKTLQLY